MKVRLDTLLVQLHLAESLEAARAVIGAGEVFVDDRVADKPGTLYSPDCKIRLKERCPYVSRGGLKLAAGLQHFHIDPNGWSCADIGASTGGFSDCLLQHGATKVIAVDVAYGQLAWKIRSDPRVVVLERCNARNLDRLWPAGESISLAVFDVSFISLTTVIPPILPLFSSTVQILALIKPQFELSREDVGPGGVVLEASLHDKAKEKLTLFAKEHGLRVVGIIPSPLLGPKGNREFLIYLTSP